MTGLILRAPQTTVTIEMAEGSHLNITESTLVLDALVITGPPDATVEITKTMLNLGNDPQVNGPVLKMESP